MGLKKFKKKLIYMYWKCKIILATVLCSLAVRYNKTCNDAGKAEELDKVCLSACLSRINSASLLSSVTIQYNLQDNP